MINHPKGYRIVVTGPESTGKTTLASDLAVTLGWAFVPEYARHYLQCLDRPYRREDLQNIALGQSKWIAAVSPEDNAVIDTSFLVLSIWHREKFGKASPDIESRLARAGVDLYLLCKPDIPWAPDPLRENPTDRERLFLQYRLCLLQSKMPFIELGGPHQLRMKNAIAAIRDLKKKKA